MSSPDGALEGVVRLAPGMIHGLACTFLPLSRTLSGMRCPLESFSGDRRGDTNFSGDATSILLHVEESTEDV